MFGGEPDGGCAGQHMDILGSYPLTGLHHFFMVESVGGGRLTDGERVVSKYPLVLNQRNNALNCICGLHEPGISRQNQTSNTPTNSDDNSHSAAACF